MKHSLAKLPTPRQQTINQVEIMDMTEVSEDLEISGRVVVNVTADIVKARQTGRILAQNMGFSNCKCTLIATVISELARNIVLYALSGEIMMRIFTKDKLVGMLITAMDKGPGIVDIKNVLTSGYSTSGGLGLGLSGIKLITDEFNIESEPGAGTRVVAVIWLN